MIYKLTFLGITPNIYYKSKEKYVTFLGTIMSAIVLMAIGSLSIYFFVNLLERKKTNLITNQLEEPMPIIKVGSHPIAINLLNGWLRPNDDAEKLFKIAIYGAFDDIRGYVFEKCKLRNTLESMHTCSKI